MKVTVATANLVGVAREEDVVGALYGQVFELWLAGPVVDGGQHWGPVRAAVSRGQPIVERLLDVGVDLGEAPLHRW